MQINYLLKNLSANIIPFKMALAGFGWLWLTLAVFG